MDTWLVIVLIVALVVVGALIYMAATRGREKRLEQQRTAATEQRQEAQSAAQRAGEADLAANRQAERAKAERERAVEMEERAAKTDPDTPDRR
jgi:flagellar biosynthesis/type III secretory pathway M-ring protein FliF/YscJ